MTVVATDTPRYSNLVKFEQWIEKGYCKKTVTYNGLATAIGVGSVLGSYIVSPTVTPGAMVGTGNATGGTASATANQFLQIGTYTVNMITATTFVVLDPQGNGIGMGATTVPFKANGLVFTITAGATPAVAGDILPIVVTGTVKYKLVQDTATDGTQNPRVIVVGDSAAQPRSVTPVVNTDTTFLVLYRGPCMVADGALVYGSTVAAGAETTAMNLILAANSGIDILSQI